MGTSFVMSLTKVSTYRSKIRFGKGRRASCRQTHVFRTRTIKPSSTNPYSQETFLSALPAVSWFA